MTGARRTQKHSALPTRHVYDAVVLGAQIGGTLTAALLSKRGHRILHVDIDGLGTSYEDQGWQLPYAPAVFPSMRLMPQAEMALQELGVAVDMHREAAGTEFQFLFPRHRLDFPSDPQARRVELAREFGPEKEKLAGVVESMAALCESTDPFFRQQLPFPPDGFFERRTVRKAAAQVPIDRDGALEGAAGTPMAGALRGLARFLGYLDDSEAGPLAVNRPLSQVLRGPHRFPGGMDGLREALRRRVGELGGDPLGNEGDPAVVEELIFDGSKFEGLRLAGSNTVYRAAALVAGLDVGALARLVPPKAKKKALAAVFESVRPNRFLFPINLVLKAEALPLGMKEMALLTPSDEELGPVLLEVLKAKKGGRESPDEILVSAAAFVAATERDAGEPRLRSLAKRVEDAVLELAPFAEALVVHRSAPLLDAKNARGSRLSPHPLLEVGDGHSLGVGGLTTRTPCKNMFLASREVLPGLGLEGEFMAGMRAATVVQELLRKHDPLK